MQHSVSGRKLFDYALGANGAAGSKGSVEGKVGWRDSGTRLFWSGRVEASPFWATPLYPQLRNGVAMIDCVEFDLKVILIQNVVRQMIVWLKQVLVYAAR